MNTMTMKNFVKCQEQQQERACKQRVFGMSLWISGTKADAVSPFVDLADSLIV